jgi:hypothetical protein
MSESTPFSIGVWPDGKPEKSHIDAEYLIEKEFTAIDELRYEYSPSTQFLEGFWKTTTGFNL